MLDHLRVGRELAIITRQYGDEQRDIIVEATRWQRLFHYLVDSLMFAFIFFPILENLIKSDMLEFLRPMEAVLGARVSLYLVCLLPLTIYYMFFEGLLQATPGKMLAETRVVTDTGGRPAVGKILTRTVSRFVPFESLSVLFSRGWHDDWSDTYVAQEKRTGVRGGYYFLIFPIMMVVSILGYAGYNAYKKHQYERHQEEEFIENKVSLEAALKQLTTSHVITVKTDFGHTIYLKVEDITPNGVTFTKIMQPVDDYYGSDLPRNAVEKTYLLDKDSLPKITLTRTELAGGIVKTYDPSRSDAYGQRGVADLLKNGASCYIAEIEEWFAPAITLDDMKLPGYDPEKENILIYIKNKGWTADLVKIKNNEKEPIDWLVELPATVPSQSGNRYAERGLTLNGAAKEINDIDLELTFRDSLGRLQVYRVQAEDDEIHRGTIKRVR